MAWLLAGGVAAAAGLLWANMDWFKNIPKADYSYLKDIRVQTLDGSDKVIDAADLWRKNGAVIMEAEGLSSLKPELDQLGIPLVGIVHEKLGVKEFQPYFKGEIYLDSKRKFYGPQERRMFISGFLRLGVWHNFFRARGKGIDGDLKGEGRILGGVFVMGAGDQGILLQHREKEFGDHVDLEDVRKAIKMVHVPSKM